MKRKLIFVLVLCILLSASACGQSEVASAGKKDSYTENGVNKESSSQDCFEWDETTIIGLTDKGREQKELVIPENCTKVDAYALSEANLLETLVVKGTDVILDEGMAWGCTSLKEVFLAEGIKEIPDNCFGNCAALERVQLPSTLEIIGEDAFYVCKNLSEIDFENTKLTDIKEGAFFACEKIKAAKFPATLKTVGEEAFYLASGMEILEFQSGIERIEEEAFYQCKEISKVVIPEGCTFLGSFAFGFCTRLSEIYLPASLTEFSRNSWAKTTLLSDDVIFITVYVKEGSKADIEFDNYNDGLMEKKFY